LFRAYQSGARRIHRDDGVAGSINIVKVSLQVKAASGESMEARRAPRERALLQGKVSYAGGSISFTCIVTQISATGAKIAINDQTSLPEHFQFCIPQKNIDCAARLVWRRAGYAGVAFKAAPAPEARASSDDSMRLELLEAENRMLRATIDHLTAQLKAYASGR
jgi:hypothetical protein